MTDMQKILLAIADEMRKNTISARQLERMAAMLDGVDGFYHTRLVLAALKIREEEEPTCAQE